MENKMVSAIILSSGTGARFKDDTPKQFAKLAGLPVLVHTLKAFQLFAPVDRIVVVTCKEYVDTVWKLVASHLLDKVIKVVVGGATRQESSHIGLECCRDETEFVLVHDGVRPFISTQVLQRLVDAVPRHEAVDTVISSADTLVKVDAEGFITEIPDRSRFRRGQTPQAFRLDLVLRAHEQAQKDGVTNATDDCGLVLRLGHPVYCVAGDEHNIKITYPIDLHIADKLFQLKTETTVLTEKNSAEYFQDKVVVIFGGTDGIGASLCRLLAKQGARVHPLGRRSDPPADVTQPEKVGSALAYIASAEGKVDLVVNCAGNLIRRDLVFTSLDEWQDMYRVNVEGSFNVAKAAFHYLCKTQGQLLFIGSSSYTRGRAGYAAYSSSKAALVNLTQALAEEWSPFGVKVNIASPGRVHTRLRERNFGKEPPNSLLKPDFVAEEMMRVLMTDTTGSVFDIG